MSATAQAAEKTLCHALPFGLELNPIEYRIARGSREGRHSNDCRNSVHPLVLAGDRTQQFRRRAGDPTPDHAGQLVIVAAQALRLAVRDFRSGSAVPANEKQHSFPYLRSLVIAGVIITELLTLRESSLRLPSDDPEDRPK